MEISPIDIAALSSPIPLPGETSTVSPGSFGINTQQNFQAMTRGSGVSSPIGTGNTTTPLPISSTENVAQAYGPITGAALESGGSNVGGVVQQAPKEDLATNIEFATLEDQNLAKREENYQEQVSDYQKAFEGDSSEKKSIKESLEAAGEEYVATGGLASQGYSLGKAAKAFRDSRKGEQSGMSAARGVKREDRKADRKARKGKTFNEETGKYEKTGEKLKGRKKRELRKAQRRQRRSAFKDFKDNLEIQAEIEASNL
jgi:hypothetical protein